MRGRLVASFEPLAAPRPEKVRGRVGVRGVRLLLCRESVAGLSSVRARTVRIEADRLIHDTMIEKISETGLRQPAPDDLNRPPVSTEDEARDQSLR
jgi:hypothetical protein